MLPPRAGTRTRMPARMGNTASVQSTNAQSRRVQHGMPSQEIPDAKAPDPTPHPTEAQDPSPPSFLQRIWLPTAVVLGSITLVAVTGYEVLAVIRLLTETHN